MFEGSCVKVEFPLEGIQSRETLWEGVWEKRPPRTWILDLEG